MRILLTVLLLTICPALSFAQDNIYWPEHEDMTGARWSPDGNYIATWGDSPLVRIWNDHDGSLAFEFDHSSLPFILPNGEARLKTDSFSIRGVTWSEDLRHIITYAQPDSYWLNFFLVVWKADTGEYVVAHSWGVQDYYTRDYLKGHEVVNSNGVAAVWFRDVMTFVDINPASASVGEGLAAIDFGEFATCGKVLWNENRSKALLKLRNDGCTGCDNCDVFFKLYDTNLNSESFGEVLWQREANLDALSFVWPNIHDLLAIQIDDPLEVWDLDRASERYGTRLLKIYLDGAKLHNVFYHAPSRRLIVVKVRVVRTDPEARKIDRVCYENDCEFQIHAWDIDIESSTFGQTVIEITHPYNVWLARWAAVHWVENDHVALGASEDQIHVRSAAVTQTDMLPIIEYTESVYDLDSGNLLYVRDIGRILWSRQHPFLHRPPQIDFDHGFDEWFWSTNVKDVHPSGSKIIVHMTSNDASGDSGWWYIRNIDTGEFFYPPDTWREQWGEG